MAKCDLIFKFSQLRPNFLLYPGENADVNKKASIKPP